MLTHTMFYVDQIRSENEFRTEVAAVGAKELELAKTFVNAMEAPFAPKEFKDEYTEQLERRSRRRRASQGRPVTSTLGKAGRGHPGSAEEEHYVLRRKIRPSGK
jgi:non-homologous end joining protein Ku